MKEPKRILFISQEITPYLAEENPIRLLNRQLPEYFQAHGYETRTFMPKFGEINERRNQLHEVIRLSGMNLIIEDSDHPLLIKVASIQTARIQIYFIDNDDLFHRRKGVADENGVEYADNDDRVIFYARGAIETVKKLRWTPDIIHCQGWMASVVPIYIKLAYHDEPSFANTKVVTSLFSKTLKKDLGANFKKSLEFRDIKENLLQQYNNIFDFDELGKIAIDYSDGVIMADKNVSDTLLKYTEEKSVPLLKYQEDFADAYEDFYNQICPDSIENE